MKKSRKLVVSLACVGVVVAAVTLAVCWKEFVVLHELGENRAFLGAWDVVRDAENPSGVVITFSAELDGFWSLRLGVKNNEGKSGTFEVEGEKLSIFDGGGGRDEVAEFEFRRPNSILLRPVDGERTVELRRRSGSAPPISAAPNSPPEERK